MPLHWCAKQGTVRVLEFEGKTYTTISDVTARYPVSVKKLKTMVRDGQLPEPEHVEHGTRRFTHYPETFLAALGKIVKPRGSGNGGGNGQG
jgi:hypothetical protein